MFAGMNTFLFASTLIACSLVFQSEAFPFNISKNRVRRVVNGEATFIKQFPWQVQLYRRSGYMCGGSIISKTWVLTAAHCVDQGTEKDYFILQGSTFTLKGTTHNLKKIVVHEKWYKPKFLNDIAAVQIDNEFTYDEFTQPVKLADSGTELPSETLLTASGHGRTESADFSQLIREGLLITVNKKDCQNFHLEYNFLVEDQHLCVHYYAGSEKGVCFGDSGGALVNEDNVQYGIVSSGFGGCGKLRAPSIFVKVSYFRDWIKSKTGV